MNDPLIEGFIRYQQQYFVDDVSLYQVLKDGQKPTTLVIGCCDSRVHPPALLGTAPGEMFVVRNVANLVPPYDADNRHASVAAALEFAVKVLQVTRVMVLGHKNCGGIRSLVDAPTQSTAPPQSALQKWLSIAETARDAAQRIHAKNPHRNHYEVCEQTAILVSMNNLLSYPWLAEKVAQGQIQIDGWYFDMQAGTLLGYDADTQAFVTLVQPAFAKKGA